VKPVVKFDTPTARPVTPQPDPRSTPIPSTSAPGSNVEILRSVLPALVEDPSSLEELISFICNAHDIDASVASTLMKAARIRSSSRPLER